MNPTPTPLASTAMEAAREIHPQCEDHWLESALKTFHASHHVEEWKSMNQQANRKRERLSAIIQKHFQPLLAKVERERDQWKREAFDSLEKAKVEFTALRADLAEKEAALHQCDLAFANWQVGQIPGRPEDILKLIVLVRSALASRADKGGAR